jgi:transposase
MICPVFMFTLEVTMRPAEWLQEVRMKRFREVYGSWRERRLSQEEAARVRGVSDRTFRRYVERYDDGGLDALIDRRMSQVSHRKAPVDEVLVLNEQYRARHDGWTVRHFHA